MYYFAPAYSAPAFLFLLFKERARARAPVCVHARARRHVYMPASLFYLCFVIFFSRARPPLHRSQQSWKRGQQYLCRAASSTRVAVVSTVPFADSQPGALGSCRQISCHASVARRFEVVFDVKCCDGQQR